MAGVVIPAYETLPDYFMRSFEPALASRLDAGSAAGEVRADVAHYDLLRAIRNLSVASGDDGNAHIRGMIDLLIDGLRYGATSAHSSGHSARGSNRGPPRTPRR